MLKRIRYQLSKSSLRVPLVWSRHRGVNANDIFVASYPRSGSTWLRFLLFETLTKKDAGFDNVNRVIPDVGMHADATPLLSNRGRLIKTHEPFRPEYRRAVYVVRDVRDVVLSEYAYQNALGRIGGTFDDYLTDFLRGTATGYGSWQEHVRGWIDSPLAKSGDLLLVRYRDLKKDGLTQLQRIMHFLGANVDRQVIIDAIQNNEFQKMRVKEERNPQLGKSAEGERRFVRKGLTGGWREQLTQEQLRTIEEKTGNIMTRLGYESGLEELSLTPNAASAD
jgi:hypothetical protein